MSAAMAAARERPEAALSEAASPLDAPIRPDRAGDDMPPALPPTSCPANVATLCCGGSRGVPQNEGRPGAVGWAIDCRLQVMEMAARSSISCKEQEKYRSARALDRSDTPHQGGRGTILGVGAFPGDL